METQHTKTYKNVVKTVVRGKFHSDKHLHYKKRSQINNLTDTQGTEKGQTKPKVKV